MTTEIVKTGGALAIRAEQTDWTEQQVAVLRQAGVDENVAPAELSAFLHLCQRTQLDPFSRQIYLIGRFDRRKERVVYTPQTGIDGYRVIAHRVTAEHRDTFGYEDNQWCGEDGRWFDVWLSQQPPAAAKVTVIRNGQRFSAVALYREYVQTSNYGPLGLWGRMPASQLAKCAEALVLRKAFPHDLAGVYTAEEMAQADNQVTEGQQRPQHLQPVPDRPSTVTAEPAELAQQIADDGATATTRDEGRVCWARAAQFKVLELPVAAPDTQQTEALGAYLTRRLGELPEQAPQPSEDGIPDAEVLDDQHDAWADALATLEAAAAKAQVRREELEEAFQAQYGTPTEQATIENLRAMTAVLTRGAA